MNNSIYDSDDEQSSDHQPDHQPIDHLANELNNLNHLNHSNNIQCRTNIRKLSDPSYDGLGPIDARKLNSNKKYIQAECCGLYFLENAFCHAAKGFSIPGMITCIHCYIALNTSVYKSDNLTDDQKLLLAYYIETFAPYHDEKKCTRTPSYENCFLCDKILNILPKSIERLNPIDRNDKCIIFDRTVVKKSSAQSFTLSI